MFADKYSHDMEELKAWWHCENTRPIVGISRGSEESLSRAANDFWANPEDEPDYDAVLDAAKKLV